MQTIKIKHKLNGFAFINESDFKHGEDELWEEHIETIEVRKPKKKTEPSYSDTPLSE